MTNRLRHNAFDGLETAGARAADGHEVEPSRLEATEASHRLRSGLELVANLLRLEGMAIRDPQMRDVFEETASRIGVIAGIQDWLSLATPEGKIELLGYLRELSARVLDAMTSDRRPATIAFRGTPVLAAVPAANALGMIVNELLTNSIKYGRRGRQACRIEVRVAQPSERMLQVTVRDHGPGFPPEYDPRTWPTLGMRIVTSLARKHGGSLTIGRERDGARVTVELPAEAGPRSRPMPVRPALAGILPRVSAMTIGSGPRQAPPPGGANRNTTEKLCMVHRLMGDYARASHEELEGIKDNSRRLIELGDARQQATARRVLAAVEREERRRRGADAEAADPVPR